MLPTALHQSAAEFACPPLRQWEAPVLQLEGNIYERKKQIQQSAETADGCGWA